MPHVVRDEPSARPHLRIALQFVICVLLAFVFVMTATATGAPPGPAATATPSRTPSPARPVLPADRRTSTPTLTPTPQPPSRLQALIRSLAPASVPGQPTPDGNTLALYHFDDASTADVDATGRYTATLHGSASIAPNSLYSGVLQLDGNGSYVDTGYLGPMNQGTIDAYVDFAAVCSGVVDRHTIIAVGNASGQNVLWLGVDYDAWLKLYIYENGYTHLASSGINACKYLTSGDGPRWPYETWRFHHVAVTWGPRGEEIWVDGILHGVGYDDYAADPSFKYFCNPQMQLGIDPWPPNGRYPACSTPVMAPTMPSYPRGDYTGPLPQYNTIRIGCNSSGVCSPARIDEVRISNVQRTFTWMVDPTVTPTPTWTPVNPTLGEYVVDGSTAALYHLDSSIPYGTVHATFEEVSQQYRIMQGNGTIIPAGRYNAAAYLGGYNSYIDIPNLGVGTGTAEAWVDFPANPPVAEPLFVTGDPNSSPRMWFGTLSQGNISLWVGGSAQSLDSGVTPAQLAGCWHHLAATWGARGQEIWIDGQIRVSNRSATGPIPSGASYWRFGCVPQGSCMVGAVDELRISNVQRTFSPTQLQPIRANVKIPARMLSPAHAGDASSNQIYLPFAELGPTDAAPAPFPCP